MYFGLLSESLHLRLTKSKSNHTPDDGGDAALMSGSWTGGGGSCSSCWNRQLPAAAEEQLGHRQQLTCPKRTSSCWRISPKVSSSG